MGLKDKNNPLGQRVPSDHVGATNPAFKHDQSAELVEGVRRRAKRGENDNSGREPLNTPKPLQKKTPRSSEASPAEPQPGLEDAG